MNAKRNTKSVFSPSGILFAVLLIALVAGFVVFSFMLRSANTPEISSGTPATGEVNDVTVNRISIDMVGDINLADGWAIDFAEANGGQVQAAFAPEILEHLTNADIFFANHEFTLSSRGEALNKYYTFRADPSRMTYWQQLGVDVVDLANNHAYDFGEEAFLDTLDALDANGIKRVGAGRNLSEAMAPAYFDYDGYRVAFVAADRSQKGDEVRAAEAGESTPGVLFCFDDALFIQAVAQAAENADFVIAVPHWGTEGSTTLEDVQVELAHKLIDAGADVVVGTHPHILQGMEFYQGKLIAYSLSDFWFNTETSQTLVLNIELVDGVPAYKIIPALQTEQQVITSEQVTGEVIQQMRALSPGLSIADDGTISPAA